MPSVTEMQAAFKVHQDEMDRCVRSKCYWALLHLVVVIPDICGGLEAANGDATKAGYVDWCRRMFPPAPPAPLTAEERYTIRCIILHQGRTLASKGRYTYYKFSEPTPGGPTVHGRQLTLDQIILDVSEMAKETKRALQDWFEDLQDPSEAGRAATVTRNLPTLVTVKPQPVPGVGGTMVNFNITHTSTS